MRCAACLLCVIGDPPSGRAQAGSDRFSWTLSESGPTSAGIYDSQNRLVRVLWTKKMLAAGNYTSNWDGLDRNGSSAPAGAYTWKVVVNRSIYNNVATIGNTGQPRTSFGHVPFFVEGVAVDAQGHVYTVHDWDEAHHDVKKWSATTGQALFTTGHTVGEALLKGIAVEPDGSYAYVTGYGGADINDRANIKFSVYRIALTGSAPGVVNFTSAGRSITVYNGNAQYPANATAADIEVMRVPLISVALRGGSLYVTDSLGGRILKYDKVSGLLQQQITGVRVACGVAVASDGRIWVGRDHTRVSVYSPAGSLLATPITNLSEVRALAIQGTILCVADRSGRIRKFTINANGTSVTPTSNFGLSARPGDRSPNRLAKINGMAMDAPGNVIVSDRMGEGSRLQKLSPTFSQLWQQMCLEFSSQAAYVKENPDLLISAYRNIYTLNRSTGSWTFQGPAGTDTDGRYFGNFDTTTFGPPRAIRWNGNDFFYYPTGDGVAIYRLIAPADSTRGPTLKLVSCLAESKPSPDGVHRAQSWLDANKYLWSWNDTQGDGQIQYTSATVPGEVTLVASPGNPGGWKWDQPSLGVDDAGWVWVASAARIFPPGPFEGEAIYAIAPEGLNSLGNPIYRWTDAKKVMDEATGRSTLGLAGEQFNWMMVNRSPNDGMVYALVYAAKAGFPSRGGSWMGGNVLFAFDGQTSSSPAWLPAPKWHVVLPTASVGMAPIPGGPGGVFVGANTDDTTGADRGGVIHHYTKDGLLIGTFKSAPAFGVEGSADLPSGAFDAFSALSCNRDPRDGLLDVFGEDNWNQRLLWYRVDDRNIQTQTGSLNAASGGSAPRYALNVNKGIGNGNYLPGTIVNVTADIPPVGQAFKRWTGDTSQLANVSSPSTTLTMPPGAVTITATYDWATGNDKIRYFPTPGAEDRLLNCVFEGTNGDPVTGAYSPFYVVPALPPPGWTEVSVNTGNFRALRYRDPKNGMVAEIEFYRNGVKVRGSGFGTPGSWNNEPDKTFDRAIDGDPSSYFNGPPGSNAYVGIDTAGAPAAGKTLTVVSGAGSGSYDTGTIVTVAANPPPAGQYFSRWTGDKEILSNWLNSTTTATMPSIDVAIAATYSASTSATLTVNKGTGSGNYAAGTKVTVSADPAPAGLVFAGWTDDTVILESASAPTTKATIPYSAVTITATYRASGDKIRYYPRSGFTDRLVGGVFEGTNVDAVTGPYTAIHTIANNPPLAWTDVDVGLGNYRYLRYRSPNGSYGNVSEVEFYRAGARVTGVGYGTAGSFSGSGSTFDKALDGNVGTFFDGPSPNGNYAGIDTASGSTPPPPTGGADKIRYYPRSGFTERMIGGVFEGTSGDPVGGPYTAIYTITSDPPLAWSEADASLGNYRYLRYRGPNGSYGNVSEIEFYRAGVKAIGPGYGTPGSWNGNGATFGKALDGSATTFFDGPTENGVYVGIDTGL
ncbi:MAG TPA: FlgD immunoglobulin-like domain containing protein [Terrimicrobiaceae bacterium]|nr:FlgD immunoglobulin-like domain containing protein [Terrimicrobiaceae bacterium]